MNVSIKSNIWITNINKHQTVNHTNITQWGGMTWLHHACVFLSQVALLGIRPGNIHLLRLHRKWELRTHAAHSKCAVARCITWESIRMESNITRTSYVFSINTLTYINIYIGIFYYDTKAARTIYHIQIT